MLKGVQKLIFCDMIYQKEFKITVMEEICINRNQSNTQTSYRHTKRGKRDY